MKDVSKETKDAGHALIDVPEVAARLGTTPDWVYDQVHWHGMPCCKFSKKMWRFHWPTVLAWAQRKQ